MTSMTTFLWFDDGQARPAAELYADTFPDSRVDPPPAGPPGGTEVTVGFTVLGRPFVGLNGGPGHRPSDAVSFQVATVGQAETDRYWDALVADGGVEGRCGWCTDRWGFSWQIVPTALSEGLGDPDPAASGRVMTAMLTMNRIDVAAIETARRG